MTENVWYWARRKGERPHQKRGKVLSSDGKHARVLVEGCGVPVQTVEVRRLHSISNDPTTDRAYGT